MSKSSNPNSLTILVRTHKRKRTKAVAIPTVVACTAMSADPWLLSGKRGGLGNGAVDDMATKTFNHLNRFAKSKLEML